MEADSRGEQGMNIKTQIKIAIGLGILSLIMGLLGHLALTDIYHGEADAALEWSILRVGALVLVVFVAYALILFGRILKKI
jgi:hypothetical protein